LLGYDPGDADQSVAKSTAWSSEHGVRRHSRTRRGSIPGSVHESLD